MAEYKLKGGYALTDVDFEALAKRAEAGEYPGLRLERGSCAFKVALLFRTRVS